MGPLTNIAPGSHPEHLFGLQCPQLAQLAGWVHHFDLNRYLLGSNSVQSHLEFLVEVRVPESKDRDKETQGEGASLCCLFWSPCLSIRTCVLQSFLMELAKQYSV